MAVDGCETGAEVEIKTLEGEHPEIKKQTRLANTRLMAVRKVVDLFNAVPFS